VLLLERRDSIYLYRPVGMYKNCIKTPGSCGSLGPRSTSWCTKRFKEFDHHFFAIPESSGVLMTLCQRDVALVGCDQERRHFFGTHTAAHHSEFLAVPQRLAIESCQPQTASLSSSTRGPAPETGYSGRSRSAWPLQSLQ
jgi:hypothetical protein